MGKLELLSDALNYIEQHLTEELNTEDIANYCFCSKSTIDKLFREINRISIHDYVIRRRLSLAAKKIATNPDKRIIDIAMEYGYGSNEAFSRAFRNIWSCSPSEFRDKSRYTQVYPRLVASYEYGGNEMRSKQVDISELYDLFKERKKCYFICCDIQQMIPINNISRQAGDMAILEALRRMNEAAGEEDVVFRVGGDEFAMLTNSTDLSYAEKIRDQILSKNGEIIVFEGQQIPLSLYAGIVSLKDRTVRYHDLFMQLQETINNSK